MTKNKALYGKKLIFITFIFVFSFISPTVFAGEVKEIWNHVSINDTEVSALDQKIKDIWTEFERSSIQRGMVVKPNYQPFVPVINRIIMLDTPTGELVSNKYYLRVETEVINGEDTRISELVLNRLSDTPLSEAAVEQQIGFARGKLGENLVYWAEQKRIIPEKLKAFDQFKLENFKRSIELEYSGEIDERRVSLEDVFHFFPELSGIKFNFDYLYPQNEIPVFKTTYEPGKIHFGSLLHSDVRISFLHNIVTKKMIHGEISWKITFSEFTTAEELSLCDSFFSFIQERLDKAGLIAPAAIRFF